jgi:hypothetical protein
MVREDRSPSSSALPRIRIDLRDIYRLDQLKGYRIDVNDEADLKDSRAKIFFLPSINETINNDIHRALVLSDATVVLGQSPYVPETSMTEQFHQAGRIHCAVVVFLGDCLIRLRDVDTDRPMTSPIPVAAFWLGYLTAMLDRKHVIVLHEDGPYFKCPTNYFEASYIPLDPDGHWKVALSRHLRSLDIRVSENSSIDSFFKMKAVV